MPNSAARRFISETKLSKDPETASAKAAAASFAEASFALFEESRLPREFYYAHTAEKCAGGFDALGFFH